MIDLMREIMQLHPNFGESQLIQACEIADKHFAQASAPLVEALEWYRDEARAVAKHKDGNMKALLASFHVLALDNGRRADAALGGTGNKPKV